jgi:hypothetical protein
MYVAGFEPTLMRFISSRRFVFTLSPAKKAVQAAIPALKIPFYSRWTSTPE